MSEEIKMVNGGLTEAEEQFEQDLNAVETVSTEPSTGGDPDPAAPPMSQDPQALQEFMNSLTADVIKTPHARLFVGRQGAEALDEEGKPYIALEEITIQVLLPRSAEGALMLEQHMRKVIEEQTLAMAQQQAMAEQAQLDAQQRPPTIIRPGDDPMMGVGISPSGLILPT